jgi:hypothetical protein
METSAEALITLAAQELDVFHVVVDNYECALS